MGIIVVGIAFVNYMSKSGVIVSVKKRSVLLVSSLGTLSSLTFDIHIYGNVDQFKKRSK